MNSIPNYPIAHGGIRRKQSPRESTSQVRHNNQGVSQIQTISPKKLGRPRESTSPVRHNQHVSQIQTISPKKLGRPRMMCTDYTDHIDCNVKQLRNIAKNLMKSRQPMTKQECPLVGYSTMRRGELLQAIRDHYALLEKKYQISYM